MSSDQPETDGAAANADVDTEIGNDPGVDETNDASNNESYHGYSVDDETQPQDTGDSVVDDDRGLEDPLDEGYSPPEKWSAAQRFGNTPLEESMGESLDQRLEQEQPEPDPYAAAVDEARRSGLDAPDPEVGDARAGRLVEPDEGVRTDTEEDVVADDVGVDGAGASAEEAAVHVVDDDDL